MKCPSMFQRYWCSCAPSSGSKDHSSPWILMSCCLLVCRGHLIFSKNIPKWFHPKSDFLVFPSAQFSPSIWQRRAPLSRQVTNVQYFRVFFSLKYDGCYTVVQYGRFHISALKSLISMCFIVFQPACCVCISGGHLHLYGPDLKAFSKTLTL